MKNFKMKKSITQKYPAKAESILSSCFVIKPATNNKLDIAKPRMFFGIQVLQTLLYQEI